MSLNKQPAKRGLTGAVILGGDHAHFSLNIRDRQHLHRPARLQRLYAAATQIAQAEALKHAKRALLAFDRTEAQSLRASAAMFRTLARSLEVAHG